MKKVLVAAPLCEWYDYCWDEFLNRVKELTYENYDLFFTENSSTNNFFGKVKAQGFDVIKTEHLHRIRDMVTRDHNIIRDKVLDGGYDYLLILDQDVIPPRDVIEKLMKHDKDIISGLYFGPKVF